MPTTNCKTDIYIYSKITFGQLMKYLPTKTGQMADQNQKTGDIRDRPEEAPPKSNVFIANNKDGSVHAVSDVEKDDKLKTVPADKKNQKNFMEVGHNSDVIDMLITALKNFKKQAIDPFHTGFLMIPKNILRGIGDNLKETGKNFREIFSGMFTEEPDDLRNAAEKNKNINQNKTDMAKKENQEPIGTNDTSKKYRILPGMVNWESLKQAGLSKEFLEKKGFLEDMLQGRKSPDTMNLNVNLPGLRFQGEGKISLQKENDGTFGLRLHPVKLTPNLKHPIAGMYLLKRTRRTCFPQGTWDAWWTYPAQTSRLFNR